jgi:predicted nucleic acid-binding protein
VPARSTAMRRMSADSERFTLDTNLLVYSVDRTAGTRHELAVEIVDRATERDCSLTLQALSEFYAVVTRKGVVEPADAAAQAEDWLEAFRCCAASGTAVRTALGNAAAGRASYWDALLVATAEEAGCTIVLSEDMADGADLGGARIHNPFAPLGGLSELTRRLLGFE